MSEELLPISNLNDFIFCPVSIYFHSLDQNTDRMLLQGEKQINGTAAHDAVDSGQYSDKASILQGMTVFCEKYSLIGKIDLFDAEKGILTERKKMIKQVYDGYVFQLYAQFFALTEMGYDVRSIRLYSMDDNRVFPIPLPSENDEMYSAFEKLLSDIQSFSFQSFRQNNPRKCQNCIYEPMCSFACGDGYDDSQ